MIACSDDSGYSFGSDMNGGGQGGSMARFTISGDYMYTVDMQTLKTFDISSADKPRYLDYKDQELRFGVETIFTKDTLLFIGSQDGMYIFNITRPEFPQQMSMVSHMRSCDPVVAEGNYAYVTLNSENTWCGRRSNRLEIYDISNPYKPKVICEYAFNKPPRGLGIDENKLFICENGIKVYDVSNPEKPVWIDDFSNIPEVHGIDTYDVIPLNGLLLVIGADGLYQFDYSGERLAYISKIDIKREQL